MTAPLRYGGTSLIQTQLLTNTVSMCLLAHPACPVPACVVSISLFSTGGFKHHTIWIFVNHFIVTRKLEPDIYLFWYLIYGSLCSSVTILSLFISAETFTWLLIEFTDLALWHEEQLSSLKCQ